MAKTTIAAGGTNALDPEYQAELEEKAKRDAANAARREKRAADKKAEAKKSPGKRSEPSKSKQEKKPDDSKPKGLSPAKKTEPPSSRDRTAKTSAGSAADNTKDE